MSINDILFSAIAILCGGGAILCSLIFCAFAVAMQRQEGTEQR